ncbi:hypothetical protein [uncultured Helicobacter sp.]
MPKNLALPPLASHQAALVCAQSPIARYITNTHGLAQSFESLSQTYG